MTLRIKKNSPIPSKKERGKVTKPVKVTDAEIAEALQNTGGVLEAASRWLLKNKGISVDRSTIGKRVVDTPALQDVKELAENRMLDSAEYGLFEYVQHKNLRAIMYVLDRKGKKRGYTVKQENEISNPDGEVFRIAPFDVQGKSREEIMAMVKEAHGK